LVRAQTRGGRKFGKRFKETRPEEKPMKRRKNLRGKDRKRSPARDRQRKTE